MKLPNSISLMFFPIISLFFLASCTSTSQVTTGFYDIKGNTASRIDREIRSKGPANGHALAQAAIRFQPDPVTFVERGNQCSVFKAKIKVIANITLPRWRNRSGASANLKRAFDSLAAYAKLHEQVHVRIAEAAAKDMEESIKNIKPAKNCKALEGKVDTVIKAILVQHDKAQKTFDAIEQKRLKALYANTEPSV